MDSGSVTPSPFRENTAGFPSSSVVEYLPDAVLVVDRSWRICFANAEAHHRLRLDGSAGAELWQVMPEAIEQVRDKHYRRAMMDGVSVRFEQYSPRDQAWYVVRCRDRRRGC